MLSGFNSRPSGVRVEFDPCGQKLAECERLLLTSERLNALLTAGGQSIVEQATTSSASSARQLGEDGDDNDNEALLAHQELCQALLAHMHSCLLYTSPSPRDRG